MQLALCDKREVEAYFVMNVFPSNDIKELKDLISMRAALCRLVSSISKQILQTVRIFRSLNHQNGILNTDEDIWHTFLWVKFVAKWDLLNIHFFHLIQKLLSISNVMSRSIACCSAGSTSGPTGSHEFGSHFQLLLAITDLLSCF